MWRCDVCSPVEQLKWARRAPV